MSDPMVIVGAGQAGLQLAESLRAEGWQGPIRLIGAETHAPYHRPPLSKAWLLGEAVEAQITIRGPEFFARKGLELETGARVVAIDRAARTITFADGRVEVWAGLALTTGAAARRLSMPGAELAGVLTLRDLDDASRLHGRLVPGARLVVIGAGFIGLEVAAAAVKREVEVTVIEAANRPMARVVSEPISAFYTDLHARNGVRIVTDAAVTGLTGDAMGHVRSVATSAGEFPADLVLVGVGAVARDDLAAAAGLACDRGIVVDACARTSDPAIVAAGDCTVRRRADGSLVRLESVQNAVEQAKSAAAALMGRDRPFEATPWFWSDQYGVKLQMVGTSAGHDHMRLRGDPGEGRFSIFYWRDGRLIGVDSVDRAQDHLAARKILDRGLDLAPEAVADPAVDLGAFARG